MHAYPCSRLQPGGEPHRAGLYEALVMLEHTSKDPFDCAFKECWSEAAAPLSERSC